MLIRAGDRKFARSYCYGYRILRLTCRGARSPLARQKWKRADRTIRGGEEDERAKSLVLLRPDKKSSAKVSSDRRKRERDKIKIRPCESTERLLPPLRPRHRDSSPCRWRKSEQSIATRGFNLLSRSL